MIRAFETVALRTLAVGTALLLGSACTTTPDKTVDETDPAAAEAEVVEEEGVETTEAEGGARHGKVNRKPYYHPGSKNHIDAMEQSLKSLESIPVAHADTKTGAEDDSE